jgi:hypothetical protein
LSTTAFASLNLVATNPTMGVTLSPSSVTENGATNLTYTFTLSTNAASNITVNYTATGTATNGTDYGAVSGTVVIASGTNSATVTVNPTGDATLEPDETVTLTVVAGTGYDIGSPSSATGTITNDDTGTSSPKVALVGINHADPSVNPTHLDGFSFVALEDIVSGTVVHFTRRIYDKTTLLFSNFYTGTVKWTAGSGVNRGDVYTVMETSSDAFTATCSDGSSCGTVTNIDAGFTIPTSGITLFAYADNNDNPTDGVTEIYSALHTGDLVAFTNGSAIPTLSNPSAIYPNAVVIDNFPNANPGRTEYKFPTERQITVSRTALVNTTNWLHAQSTATAPSTVRFTNIIVTSGVANPLVTVTASPSSVLENSGTGMVYTFTLSANATSNITVNFGVSGTATFGTDYTASGAASFTASTGSVVIPSGSNSASVTLTPTADATLEPNETAILTIDVGTGYDSGSPSVATGTIANDDVRNVNPAVVIVGMNHGASATEPDGLSFAANQTLTAGTEIYFVDGLFNNTALTFNTLEAVMKYTVGAGGLAKGQVVYVVETGQTSNAFTVSCSAGSNCGTATYVTQPTSTDFSFASGGDNVYAYSDTDGDPTNGITDVFSLFYAINSALPSLQNPTTVFPNAVVVTGLGTNTPNRTEYKFASSERASAINLTNIQTTSNYLIGQTTQALSVVPFTALDLCPATISTHPASITTCSASTTTFSVVASGSNLTYQWQVNTGSGFTNITNGGVYSGATTATLTLTAVTAGFNSYTYQCVVNDCRTSNSATLTVQSPQGDPSVYGTNIWRVYAWNAGGGTIASAGNWTTNYSGFYTNSNLSFNTTTSWANTLSPSSAVATANTTAYQGCTVPNDVHSWSAKRQGFPCGYYQLDIPTHNDAVQLWVNGTKVYELDAAGSNHTNVWTGFLGTTDQVEFRVTEGTGGSEGQLTLTALSFPATTTNNALNFDGANDYVAIKNCSGAALDVLNAITIEYWFKGSSNQSAVRLQPDGSNYIVAGWNGKHIISSDGGTTGIKVSPTTGSSATDGNWHHVAMTWQRNTANGFTSYLDGQIVEQRTSANVALPTINSGMFLGTFNGSSEFMTGTLDEVRVWNVVRTQTEIQTNMMGCTALGATPNLVLYYQFNHGAADGANSGINTMVNTANSTTYPAALNNFALTGSSSNWTSSPLCTDTYTWTGAASTDWANVSNWSPAVVPSSTSSITIPTTTNGLMLAANRTINQLTFTGNTKIKLDGFNLTVNSLNGGGPNAYVVTSGTVGPNPTLTIKNVGTTATLFPVGPSETVYAPAIVTNNVARDFTVKVGTAITNAAVLTKTVNLQWDITPSVSTGNSATLGLGWTTASQGSAFNPSAAIEVAHYNSTTTAWDVFRLATRTGAGTAADPYVATVTGVNAFSPFVVANQNALPIELLDFKGTPQYNGNLLTWTTASEVNNKGFNVERIMANGQWGTLDFVKSTSSRLQTSTTLNATYDFTDNQPLSVSYYRLRQIDNDGKETLSKVIAVSTKGNGKLTVYPNPVSNVLTVEVERKGMPFYITNLLGQQVLSGKATPQLDVSALPKGAYFLRIGTEQVKFVKQ